MPSLPPPNCSTFSKFYSNPKKIPCIVKSFINLCSQGQLSEAISSLSHLSSKGIQVPSEALAYLVQQCGNTKSLKLGKWVHLHMKLNGFKRPNTFLTNNLIRMYCACGDLLTAYKLFDRLSTRNLHSWNIMLSGYAKLGKLKPARKLFDKMPERDVVSWNTMMIAHSESGFYIEALRFYMDLRVLGIGYNAHTFAGLLTICVKLKELELTKQAHAQVFIAGFLSNLVVSSSLLDAYSKCGVMDDARRLFDEMEVRDVLTWTSMVSGYAQWGHMEDANELFNLMPVKNSVSWTSLISGYARHGSGHKALELFREMIDLGFRPDQFTYSSCLCACAVIALLNHGKQIHGYLIRTNFRPNAIAMGCLIDMYSKCGNLEVGKKLFKLKSEKGDVVLWNTMISALAQHGHGKEAIHMFDDMIGSGVKPDGITLIVVIHACSHSVLVEEGLRLFESITGYHGVVPDVEHYACLIELLGRAGSFYKLINQLDKMPCKRNERIWNALVGVCRIHGNVELGKESAEQLIELQPPSSAAYLILSSMYAALGSSELVEKVRQLMNERNVKKDRAISWTEIENKVHTFTVSDMLHPSKEVIYLALDQLASHMEEVLSHNCER